LRTLPLLCTLACLLSSVALRAQTPAPRKAAAKAVFWSGQADGVRFQWTDRDLTATVGGAAKPAFSIVRMLKKEFGKPEPDNGYSIYEVAFFPLSAVGSLLSYERDDYWDGGAHPSGNESFETIDARRPGRKVKLTDLFDAAQIRRALLADPVVQRVLTREKIAPPPTLDGLIKALANKQFGGEDDGKYSFPQGLLYDFSFHHVENGKVAVRFLLPHGYEIYRFQHTQLALLLPIPPQLKSAFTQAAAGRAGALTRSLQRVTAKHESSLTLLESHRP
jgi:hypothetical protein